jgi:voltage-gated potassium channel
VRSQEIEKRLEIPLLMAAALTIPALILEDQPGHSSLHAIGLAANYAIWLVFAGEVVVMLAVVPSRSRWLRDHPLEVVIVVLTPPFLLSAVQGIRVLRAVRLLRLFRLGPLARHLFSMEGLRYASLLALLTLLAAAEAFSSAEHASFGNGVYWALQTMTTAGQGDPRPHTVAGKIVASVAMLVGIGFFAVVTGAVAQRFLSTEVVEVEEAVGEVALAEEDVLAQVRDISERLRRLEDALATRSSR